MATAIRSEGLSKSYRISHLRRERYTTLRETLGNHVRNLGRRFAGGRGYPASSGTTEEFWALKDVGFEIAEGERVGIIGRNGAGKSTLLKILSRITEPTRGRVVIYGRVASLLEVGTGFHPELTGRENIFLNGAVLGMGRNEIRRKFDEIVAFAEVERFLDTPVKRYSSGMYVRLAFAVAAHLDPEILVIDEVLAVGDVQFQQKCLGKMEQVGNEGRTVLFVSHNLPAVVRLCNRSMLLRAGQLVASGTTRDVIDAYLDDRSEVVAPASDLSALPRAQDLGENLRFTQCSIVNSSGEDCDRVLFGEPFKIRLVAEASASLADVSLVIGLDTQSEVRVATLASEDGEALYACASGQPLQATVTPLHLTLKPGRYFLTLGARSRGLPLDHLPHAVRFDIENVPWRGRQPVANTWGVLHLQANWSRPAPRSAASSASETASG
jgi:homopolymeric O-antigen transport system ATP-binding protein